MKTFAILIVAAGALLFAACSQTESIDESLAIADKSVEMNSYQGDTCTYDDEITDAEIEGLILMREEEKLAQDVYLYFYGIYGEAIFQNIANSETSHTNAVLNLLEGYGQEDPALDNEGEFTNPALAELYASLIAEGEKGLVEALTVGATIEDLDIFDLKEFLAVTENTDIIRVYENLLAGSENHMRAFMNALEIRNATYEPQYITVEELEAILSAENSRGNSANNRNGYGQGGSSGSHTASGDCDGTGASASNGNQGGSKYGNHGN